jgi:hypothetical protein
MKNRMKDLTPAGAALIAGLALLGMVIAAPIAELYLYPKLFYHNDAAETFKNLSTHESMFVVLIMAYWLTFFLDIIAAWALYVMLRPVHRDLSLLSAIFRAVYSLTALFSLSSLVSLYWTIHDPRLLASYDPKLLELQISLDLIAFKRGWYFGLLFFGIHLVSTGYLTLRSGFVPKVVGLLLFVSGFGYLATTLQPLLFPSFNIDVAKYTFYGELIFMLWLLIWGFRIQIPPANCAGPADDLAS